jgi:hypothetical protein
MQKRLVLTLLLCCVYFSPTGARGQEPPPEQQPAKEPAKIELGVHVSSFNLGPQIDPFSDFQDRAGNSHRCAVRL